MSHDRYAWHAQPWQLAHLALQRGAHAVLVVGAAGLGKARFAADLAAAHLCMNRGSTEYACGKCESCHWRAAGTHPDYALVERPSDEDEAAPGATGSGTARAKPIGVDQIRALGDLLSVSAHRGNAKAIVIRPADALNVSASNALLKNLEEPPVGVLFVLVADRPALILPTVRSRCQTISISLRDRLVASAWLKQEGIDAPELPLALAGGAPLEAASIAADAQWGRRRSFLQAVMDDGSGAVRVAETFRDLAPALVLTWLQKWTYDLVAMRACGQVRYHIDMRVEIERLAAGIDLICLTRFYRELGSLRRHVHHPLNARLFLEQMLIGYARAVGQRLPA